MRFRPAPPIFVGGTGLYFRALAEGISEMPEIPPDDPRALALRLAEEGAPKLHRILLQDAIRRRRMRLRPTDGQRIVRALEVLEASGRSILELAGGRGPAADRPRRARASW